MKFIATIIFLLSSTSVSSEVLCREWKPEVTERRDEASFDKQPYLKALGTLKFYSENKGIDPWPAYTKVQGYLLKQAALSELDSNNKSQNFTNYCNFIVQQGVHRD